MRESMEIYPRTAAERAMKLQEVLLRATALARYRIWHYDGAKSHDSQH